MLATCIQHEMDHLKVYYLLIIYLNLKKDMIIKKLSKQKKKLRENCCINLMAFKILFMGTPEFAVPILKSIHYSKHKIIRSLYSTSKKKNRGQKILNSPIHDYAKN